MHEPIPGRKLTNLPMIGRLMSVCGISSHSGAPQMAVSCRSFETAHYLVGETFAVREVDLKGLQNLTRYLSSSFHLKRSSAVICTINPSTEG